MALFVECGNAGHGGPSGMHMPVEIGSELQWSESVASAAATKKAAASDDCVFTLTATVDGYASFGPSVSAAAADPRRRIIAGQRLSFAAKAGDKVGWTEGA
jgi:hypothetical protein